MGNNKLEETRKPIANELETMLKQLPSLNNLLNEYSTIIDTVSDSNSNLSMGLGKVIGIQESYATKINALVKNMTFLEERNSALNKSYGLNSISAAKFGKQLRALAVDGAVSGEKMMQYASDLKSLTSGFLSAGDASTGFRKKLLQAQQFMQNNLKVSSAAAEGYEYYASTIADSGAEALTVQKNLADVLSAKTGIDSEQIQKDLIEGIGKAGADLQLQYSRIPGTLELAVLKANALGTSIEGLNSTGQNLLNIEQSIGQEMEYQLLSGKRLLTQDGKSLTNAYRQATIQGDANKQAELMDQFLKDQGPILEKNLFARKKAAELMGTDEATLARMLQKQKIMSELGVESLMKLNQNDIGAVVSKLRKDGVDESKIQSLIESTDTRTTAEVANGYLESINEKIINASGVNVAAASKTAMAGTKAFEPMMTQFSSKEMMSSFGAISNFGETFKALTEPLNDLVAKIPLLGTTISKTIKELTNKLPTLQTGTTGTVSPVPVQDSLIIPDRGPILKPAPNDVIAAFRPGDVIDKTLKGGGGSGIDYNKMAMAIAAAMQNVKVEATIKTDNLFGATKQNTMGKSF
jgi:hypothetical protein